MSDFEFLRRHLTTGERGERLAEFFNVTPSAARGQLSRAYNSPMNRRAGFEILRNTTPLTSTTQRLIDETVTTNKTAFEERLQKDALEGGYKRLFWFGDLHWGGSGGARLDTLELAFMIAEDAKADYWTALNDFFDHAQYSRHEDRRTLSEKIWDADPALAGRTFAFTVAQMKAVAPNSRPLDLWGNHDRWALLSYYQRQDGSNDYAIASFFITLRNAGVDVTHFDPYRENVIKLSPGLKIVHGISASGNDHSVGKATIEALAGSAETGDSGISYNTASGHVHRDFITDYAGVRHYNFGTLGTLHPNYLKHKPNKWQWGVGVIDYDPAGRTVQGEPIRFVAQGKRLTATWRGKHYETALDDN
jgi:hypothetical protein